MAARIMISLVIAAVALPFAAGGLAWMLDLPPWFTSSWVITHGGFILYIPIWFLLAAAAYEVLGYFR